MVNVHEEIFELLKEHQDALWFLKRFNDLCHAIDDIIDEPSQTPEQILLAFNIAHEVYGSDYYAKNRNWLQPVIFVIHNEFCDSVKWEKETGWKKQWSDVLRSTGNNLTILMVQMYYGYEKSREFSERVREFNYSLHHTVTGDPI